MRIKKKYLVYGAIILVAVIALVDIIVVARTKPANTVDVKALAKCLAGHNATMYGAFWCTHCQNEKALFGSSFELINYVECSTPDGQNQTQICMDKNITGYPTWDINGVRHEGELTLVDLAAAGHCPI